VQTSTGRGASSARRAIVRRRCVAAGAILLLAGAARTASARTLYSVTDEGRALTRIDTSFTLPEWTRPITGLQANERVVAADSTPYGRFFAITDRQRLYAIDLTTVDARLVAPLSVALPGTPAAMDVNPVTGLIRVITTEGDNLNIDPESATVTIGTRVSPGFAISAIAYTNNLAGARTTTLYGFDAAQDRLVRIGVSDGASAADTGEVTVVGQADDWVTSAYDSRSAVFDIATDGTAHMLLTSRDGAITILVGINLTNGSFEPRRDVPGGRSRGLAAASAGVLEFAPSVVIGPGGESGIASIVIARTGGVEGILSARVVVLRSTATAGVDYTFVPATVTFADGDSTPKSLPCAILDDSAIEPIETVVFALTEPGPGVGFGAAATAALAILSNDTQYLQSSLSFGINSPVSVSLTSQGLPGVGSYAAAAATISVSGGTHTNTWTSTTPVRWSSDRGFSGIASDQTRLFAIAPQWYAGEIPLRPGINTLTFSTQNGDGRVGFITLIVMVDSYVYSSAEGAAGAFFDTEIAVLNPTDTPAPVTLAYLTADGTSIEIDDNLAPRTRRVYDADEVPAIAEIGEFSATVTSRDAVPLVVERTTRWGAGGYGSHAARAVDGADRNWYFAEGAQGFFQTFLLLANPGAQTNAVTVDWLREGVGRLTTQYVLPPRSRTTIYAGGIPGLVNRSFGIKVAFSSPGVAERAMYFGDDPPFTGGHATAGVTAPASLWYLAEGATGEFFDTFILLLNPNPFDVDVVVTYYTPATSGAQAVRIAAESRVSINIETVDPQVGARAAVSAQVQCRYPIVAERAQYWPGHALEWYEAHASFGAPSASPAWAFADGRVGGPNGDQTYLLLMNPHGSDAEVGVTFYLARGTWLFKTFTVPARARLNVSVAGRASDVPEIIDASFWMQLESSLPIVAERAMYRNEATGRIFSAGTHVVGTPLR
jgi:Domain of unknown function (DUF4394)/Calx-beta domain